MRNIKIYLAALLAFGLVFTACDEEENLIDQRKADNPLPDTSPPTGDNGSVTLSKYVSIGNSITAGYMDRALYTDGQNNSFANMLGTQFQISGVGGGSFNQPDINSANGYSGPNPNNPDVPFGRYVLDLSIPGPVPTLNGQFPTAYSGDKSSLNNFGVPNMRVTDMFDVSFAARNPLYARFASNPGGAPIYAQIAAAQPTFFTYWLGSNDVLGYAVGGGVDESTITSNGDFQTELTNTLGALVQNGTTRGMVLSLPPMVVLPYFRAVAYNAIPLDQATADQLNDALQGVNDALFGLTQLPAPFDAVYGIDEAEYNKRKIQYSAGRNAILMHDKDLQDLGPNFDFLLASQQITPAQRQALAPYEQSRPATAADLPTLSAGAILGSGAAPIGLAVPIGDEYVLSANEVTKTVTARATFNGIIKGVVDGINAQAGAEVLTIVDVQPTFANLFGLSPALAGQLALGLGLDPDAAAASQAAADGVLGLEVNGQVLQPDFSPNGVFSVDGIHPNPRGHALIANLILDAMEETYGTNLPRINVLAQRGILVQ